MPGTSQLMKLDPSQITPLVSSNKECTVFDTRLPGSPGSWEDQMVEYPCVIPEPGRLRLFYCGNGYGATGIGVATADV